MKYEVVFFQKENGDIPVLEFILSLNPKIRAKAYSEIELLKKHGSDLREPYVKPMKGYKNKGLYELRVKFSSDISRIFYFAYKSNVFVLLHGFTKKTNKTPENEIQRARKNKIDYEKRTANEKY